MAIQNELKKTLKYNFSDVLDYLEELGFTVNTSSGKILWGEADNTTNCYWKITNNTINFIRTDGEFAFNKSLVDFNMTKEVDEETINLNVCAIVFIPLVHDGCALYLGMVPEGTHITDITFCCENGNSLLNNGLVVCSAPEADNHWYYGWNHHDTTIDTNVDGELKWCLDNGHNNYEYGDNISQIPRKQVIPSPMSITLVRSYLNFGDWSENFRVQVTGDLMVPGCVFKIEGQKYIVFTNNLTTRAPAYKMPAESAIMNLATSTEEYSSLKLYAVGDYCIFEKYLYKCIDAVLVPEPFNENKWRRTTVHDELIAQGGNIYG